MLPCTLSTWSPQMVFDKMVFGIAPFKMQTKDDSGHSWQHSSFIFTVECAIEPASLRNTWIVGIWACQQIFNKFCFCHSAMNWSKIQFSCSTFSTNWNTWLHWWHQNKLTSCSFLTNTQFRFGIIDQSINIIQLSWEATRECQDEPQWCTIGCQAATRHQNRRQKHAKLGQPARKDQSQKHTMLCWLRNDGGCMRARTMGQSRGRGL